MTKVLLEMSLSLDGYATGPDVSPDDPLGRGGEALHDWMFANRSGQEAEAFQLEKFRDVGAVIVGRRMADLGIRFWGDNPVFRAPVFVVTHRPDETIVKEGGTSYVFVTGGIDEALRRAREAAGSQDIMIGGGPDVARQYLDAGAVDELRLHVAPIVLGGGERLFDGLRPEAFALRPAAATTEPLAVHLVYEVEPKVRERPSG